MKSTSLLNMEESAWASSEGGKQKASPQPLWHPEGIQGVAGGMGSLVASDDNEPCRA